VETTPFSRRLMRHVEQVAAKVGSLDDQPN
jgi:hypothetical protein